MNVYVPADGTVTLVVLLWLLPNVAPAGVDVHVPVYPAGKALALNDPVVPHKFWSAPALGVGALPLKTIITESLSDSHDPTTVHVKV